MHFDFISHYRTNVVYKTNDEIVVVNEYKNENRGKLVINKMNDPITIFYDHKHPYVFIYSGLCRFPFWGFFVNNMWLNIIQAEATNVPEPIIQLVNIFKS